MATAAQVAGGGKGCFWGCLGLADCEEACDFDAIRMNDHGLPVVDEAAVHGLRRLRRGLPQGPVLAAPGQPPAVGRLRSLEAGDELLDDCEVACTACGRCAMDARA